MQPVQKYDPLQQEPVVQQFWESNQTFKFTPVAGRPFYSIDVPPPTVSGDMHIGHAFSYAQMDFVARYKRMRGFNVLYPFGTDNNGIPTERLVEKIKKVKARDMPRQDFIDLCQQTLDRELIPTYIQDWKRIGVSCDFNLLYSTIDERSRRISQSAIIDLHRKGRLFRSEAPSMWCPECQTGISQVECEDKELQSTFNHLVFKTPEGQPLEIATTRPELLPACVAMFYHPSDSRYRHLNGRKAVVPIFGHEVPILPDERASPDKGTGLVMCCTFGDQTDMEWQKAHNLPIREAITPDGRMTELARKYKGMKIHEAREAIIADLKSQHLLTKQEPLTHFVNVHERCGTEIEFIKSKQWFIRMLDLKEDMFKWGEQLHWYPDFMKHRYDNWVNGLQWDWLISRQRYFGVPFPIWYCEKCSEPVFADEKDLPVDPLKDKPPMDKCPKCGHDKFTPESDVLDTWATSSLTPRLVLSLVDSSLHDQVFPLSLRPQAHDIITFWLFKTVLRSQLHHGVNPFRDIMISGFVTLKGQKMSKSKGNVVRPQDVTTKYGADALRYWASTSKLGKDLDYQEKDVVTARKFITKLFNAANFVFMNLDKAGVSGVPSPPADGIHPTDALFLSRLNSVITEATQAFDSYEYSQAKSVVENFFWKEFCDNYLEIVKTRVYSGGESEQKSALFGLYTILKYMSQMMAPFTPHITEYLWQIHFRKFEKTESIHLSEWPTVRELPADDRAPTKLETLMGITARVRQAKTQNQKSLKEPIILTLPADQADLLGPDVLEDLKAVTAAREVKNGEFSVVFAE